MARVRLPPPPPPHHPILFHIIPQSSNQLREKQIRDDALQILEEHGSVILITEGKKKITKVNPKLLED